MMDASLNVSALERRTTLRDLLYVWFKYQRSMVLIIAIAMAGAGLFLLVAKPTYKAEASVLVKLGKDELAAIEAIPREQNNFVLQQRGQIINNEIEILRSDALLRAVAPIALARQEEEEALALKASAVKRALASMKSSLKPIKDFLREQGLGSSMTREQAFVMDLAKGLKIEAVEETEVIRLTYSDSDAERSAFLANMFLDTYHRLRSEVHGNEQTELFYEEQLERLGSRLKEIEGQITAFQKQHGITNLDLQKELLVREISDLERQDFRTKMDIAESQIRFKEITRSATAKGGSVPSAPSRSGANYAQLDDAYFKLAADTARLETRYAPTAREIEDVEEQKSRLKLEKSLSVGRAIEGDLAVQQADQGATKTRLSQLKADLARLNEITFTLADMERSREALRSTYLTYQKKVEELRVSADLNRNQITSVKTVSRAYPPILPASPKKWLVLALALVVGLFFSFAYAVISEFFNHTFRHDQDVSDQLGLPTLASLGWDSRLISGEAQS